MNIRENIMMELMVINCDDVGEGEEQDYDS